MCRKSTTGFFTLPYDFMGIIISFFLLLFIYFIFDFFCFRDRLLFSTPKLYQQQFFFFFLCSRMRRYYEQIEMLIISRPFFFKKKKKNIVEGFTTMKMFIQINDIINVSFLKIWKTTSSFLFKPQATCLYLDKVLYNISHLNCGIKTMTTSHVQDFFLM